MNLVLTDETTAVVSVIQGDVVVLSDSDINGSIATLGVVETTTIVSAGEQGPPGINGLNGAGAVEYAFAFGDATPANIVSVPSGKMVYRVGLHINQAFDGVGAQITVGDALDQDRLMTAIENDPTMVGSHETSPAFSYGSDTNVTITIVPGAGASQGAGLLTLYVQQ